MTAYPTDRSIAAPSQDGGAARIRTGWVVTFLLVSALYGATASRTIGWQDSGQFVLRVMRGELANPYGLALVHPLYYWFCRACAWVVPIDAVVLLPLIAAMMGAAAVANVFGIVKSLTRKTVPAALAAASLALAHTFWHMSTLAKGIDPLAAMLLTLEIACIIRWDRTRKQNWLILLFLVNGLGLANLNMAMLTLPVIGIILLLAVQSKQASWKTFVASGIAWVLGSSLFTGYVAWVAMHSGDAAGTVKSALVGKYTGAVVGTHFDPRLTLISIAFTALSFPNLTLLAALLGIARSRRVGVPKLTFIALLGILAIHLIFVLRYQVVDQYSFLLPAYSIVAIFAGLGFAAVDLQFTRQIRKVVFAVACIALILTPAIYTIVPRTARRFHALGANARNKPFRDDYGYLFRPFAGFETSADQMSRAAVALAGEHGVVITEDSMASFAIDYRAEKSGSKGITILQAQDSEVIAAAVRAGRAVVLVPASVDSVPANPAIGHWVRNGNVYVLSGS